jgi:putative glutamine amidotransferase
MKSPLILVSPSQQTQGAEFSDVSLSLSAKYCKAVQCHGAVPLVLPLLPDEKFIQSAVVRCQGVMLTGGDDLNPDLYTSKLTPKLRATLSPIDRIRDFVELLLIDEVFRQKKPLLAICRGHQLLNVALGGSLFVDIPSEIPTALDHRRLDRKNDPVHEILLEPDCLLARLSGTPRFSVNSSHHQAVRKIAPILKPTGKSEDGVIESMELSPKHRRALPFLISVQYHPERLYDRHAPHAALFAAFVAACARHA